MTPESMNGGAPSTNGGGPEGSPKKGAEDGMAKPTGHAAAPPEVTLLIEDRLDALERALGTVRRRGMGLKVFSLARESDQLVLVFRADPDRAVLDRWIAELGALVDVRQVRVSEPPAGSR